MRAARQRDVVLTRDTGGEKANRRRRPWWLVAGLLLGAPGVARAELPNNDYRIDLFQGPVLAPIRVTGIAGAYAGVAEGIPGFVSNAASPALREPFSVSYVDFDIAASLSIPIGLFENNDFDNNGDVDFDYSNFIYLNVGGLLQVGPFGAGAIGEFQRYTITDAGGATNHITLGKYNVLAGFQVLSGQLMFGGGIRGVSMGLDAPETEITLLGVAPQIGVIVRPDWSSWRLSSTFRFPVTTSALAGGSTLGADGIERAGGLVLPESAVLPWEIESGLAVQVGPRPLNPAWLDPSEEEGILDDKLAATRAERAAEQEIQLSRIADPATRRARSVELTRLEVARRAREDAELETNKARLKEARRARYANWPRERLLLTASLLVSGAVSRGVSLEQFLGQNQPARARENVIGSSGAEINFSPRVGIETEPVPSLIATRFGTYYEPNRFADPVGRQHFTFGADLKLFPTTWFGLVPEVVYKIQASADLAPRYESFSAGIGVWR